MLLKGACNYNPEKVIAKVKTFQDVVPKSVDQLKAAIA